MRLRRRVCIGHPWTPGLARGGHPNSWDANAKHGLHAVDRTINASRTLPIAFTYCDPYRFGLG
jgi:hypothetical protein